ncbi:MAG: hypothetical protein ACM3ML_07585 [Micromonosporaceae bacterium]
MSQAVLLIVLIALIATIAGGLIVLARRLGSMPVGDVVVRCLAGHLFMTIWIPGGSFKAIRLGWFRIQHCPVGNHVTVVTPVRDSDLTDEERRIAAQYHDTRVP